MIAGKRTGKVVWAVVLCAVAALVLAGCRGGKDKPAPESAADLPVVTQSAATQAAVPTTAPTETPTEAAGVEPSPAPEPPRPADGSQLVRIVVPKAKIDHKVVVRGLTAKREMEDPGGKDDIAWYNFSTLPGLGSNAVFSGHVDWYTGDRGVFWFLKDLKEGDEAQVHYSDGLVISYRVSEINVYDANNAPVVEITGPTSTDRLTMITCDGVFQRSAQDYTKRRVVVAERV